MLSSAIVLFLKNRVGGHSLLWEQVTWLVEPAPSHSMVMSGLSSAPEDKGGLAWMAQTLPQACN